MKGRNYRNTNIENRNTLNLPNQTIEGDQKDIIVDKLKAESVHLTQNEQQYQRLKQQYGELDRRFRALQEQKNLQDNDFGNRHQSSIRHICQLKNQLDAMQSELRDKGIEIGDLESEYTALSHQLEQKHIELDNHHVEVNSLKADGQQMQGEKEAMTEQQAKITHNNFILRQRTEDLQTQNSTAHIRVEQMQRYCGQLEIEAQLLTRKLEQYQSGNNQLDNEILLAAQDVNSLGNQIKRNQAEMTTYRTVNAQLTATAEKHRSETIHLQKSAQAELMKNNDTIRMLNKAENVLKVRQSQVQQGRKEIQALENEHKNLQAINTQLLEDLQACRKHLEDLGLLNKQLLVSLEGFNGEDGTVRDLIDRRPRVEYARSRVTETNAVIDKVGKCTQRTSAAVSARGSLSTRHYRV